MSALVYLTQLLTKVHFCDSERCQLLLSLNVLLAHIGEFVLKLVKPRQLVLLNHLQVVFEFKLFLKDCLHFVPHLVKVHLNVPLFSQSHLNLRLLLHR